MISTRRKICKEQSLLYKSATST